MRPSRTLFATAAAVRSLWCTVALAASGACAAAGETVKIGFIEVLSGPFALAGPASLRQLREVIDQLNLTAMPADPRFEVVPFDGKGSPQEAPRC